MFAFRINGASLLWLSRKYKRHHTTILWHCRRAGIYPDIPIPGGRRSATAPGEIAAEMELDLIDQTFLPPDLEINQGMMYVDYLDKAMKDPAFKSYFDQFAMDPSKYFRIHRAHRAV